MVSDLSEQKIFENERLLSLFIPSQLLFSSYQNWTQQSFLCPFTPLLSTGCEGLYTKDRLSLCGQSPARPISNKELGKKGVGRRATTKLAGRWKGSWDKGTFETFQREFPKKPRRILCPTKIGQNRTT